MLHCLRFPRYSATETAAASVPEPVALLVVAELSPATVQCREAARSKKLRQDLAAVVQEAGLTSGCDKSKGNLLYASAVKVCRRIELQTLAAVCVYLLLVASLRLKPVTLRK